MKIRAERDDLADVLSRAGRAVSTRSPLPILQGLLCEVDGATLTVTGTDNEVTIRTKLEVEVLEEGKTVLPAKLAAEAVRKLPAGAVTVHAGDGQVEITGNGPRFMLRELSVDDFPRLPEPAVHETLEVDGDVLLRAISQVGVAAATDESRPTLTGVLFEHEAGQLRLVATDSYRLAVRDVFGVESRSVALVPYRALRELARAIGDKKMSVGFADREAVFSSDRGRMVVRLIEANFPNYRQLLPESFPNRLRVEKDALVEALGRAALVGDDHIPARFHVYDAGLDLSVIRQEVGEETEHIDAEYEGEEMTIAFNTRYLSDGLAVVDADVVVLEITDPLKPGLLHGEGAPEFRYLVMPVRL